MIEKIPFGRTGHMSTRTIFGAAALGNVTQDEADRTLDVLLEYGINHIDTAANYGDSEKRIGPWMDRHRGHFFLATKTEQRTREAARDSIHRSLDRMRVDQIDLLQLHNLWHPEQWDTAMGPGGALEAAIEARDEGLIRFIGVTGHGTTIAAMHRRALERFDFDSVLLPYNLAMMNSTTQYAEDFERLLVLCEERNVAVQTIKAITRGPWGSNAAHTANTWYEPLTEQADIDAAVAWVLARPGIFLNTAGDIHLLPKILDAAARFDQEAERATLDATLSSLDLQPLFVE